MNWRQVDCHINNLYNTTFWALVNQGELSAAEAHERLKGTQSKDKHEILFSQFQINYDKLPSVFKRGTIFIKVVEKEEDEVLKQLEDEDYVVATEPTE